MAEIKKITLLLIVSFFISLITGIFFIPILKRIKAGQPILKYVEAHKNKNGTPTMGGLFFILSASITFVIFFGLKNRLSNVILCIGLAFMTVGFLDDFLKIKLKENEGLKPYQKIIFQTSIAVIAGFFAYKNNITDFYVPFTKITVNLGVFSIFLIAFLFIAITNGVNLTDGLDGLASSSVISYLIVLCLIIYYQINNLNSLNFNNDEGILIIYLSICLVGSLLGFLVFNTNKACVFMGDTGSLSLGGFIGAISVFSGNSLFVPVLGLVFVVSLVSVIMQVLYFKKTKKRIFLMAPFHHHLELKGFSEAKISYLYSIITVIIGLILLIFYM